MKHIIGAYLIDTPFSALNNSGLNKSAANENEIITKVIYSPEGTRPYVSAQALRYWWRNVLEDQFGWNCSPVERDGKKANTKNDPFTYDDDDVFGYMDARKSKSKNLTVTRVSPLKCSPLIGYPIRPTSDFGVLIRKLEGNAILFNHQFYSNILKGIFALNIDNVGKFTMIDKPGSMNISKELADEYVKKGLKQLGDNTLLIDSNLKAKRIEDTIKALKYINGGAMQTLHHTDVTPKFILLALINGGNNIFMNVLPHNKYENGLVDIDALYEVLDDYKDKLLSNVYVGILSGFGTDKDKELQHFNAPENVELIVTTPAKAIDKFIGEVCPKKIEENK